jgi:hypothetical protein
MLRGTWRTLKPGGLFFLPPRVLHRNGNPDPADRRPPIPVTRWFGALSGG